MHSILGRVLFHVKWTVLHDKTKFCKQLISTRYRKSWQWSVLLSEIKDSGYDGNLGLKTEQSAIFVFFKCMDRGTLHTWVIIVCPRVSLYLFWGYYTTQFRKLGRMCVVHGVLPKSFLMEMRCMLKQRLNVSFAKMWKCTVSIFCYI